MYKLDIAKKLCTLSMLGLAFACGDEATVIGAAPGAAGSAGEPVGAGGAGGTDVGAGGTAGSSGEACVENPTAPEEYLVRCTDSACRPFDNVARLGLYRAGEPLPEVP